MSSAERQRPHLDYLDGVRALAAMFVVLNHGWALNSWDAATASPRPGVWRFTLPLMFGHFAVSVFIVVSGFCLMLPHASGHGSGSWPAFFKRRAKRILVPYYFALMLGLGLALAVIPRPTGTTWDESIPVTAGGALSHLLLLQNLFSSAQINPALWSIATEWQIYFIFPLLVLIFRRGPTQAVFSALGLSLAGIAVVDLALPGQVGFVAPQYVFLFTLGMLSAHICFSERAARLRRLPWLALAALPAGAFVGYAVQLGCEQVLSGGIFFDFLIGLAAAGLLIGCCPTVSGRSRTREALSWRPLTFIGLFSYSIYLIHAPLLQVEWQYGLRPFGISGNWAFAALELVGVPLLLVPCYLFAKAFEFPFARKDGGGWPSRLWRKRRLAAPALAQEA